MNEKRQINLLSRIKGARFTEGQLKRLLTGISFLTSFFLIVVSVVLFIVGGIYQGQMATLTQNIKVVEEGIEGMREREILYRGVADKLQVSDRLLKIGSFPVLLVEEFVSLLPEDVVVSEYHFSRNKLTATLSTESLFSLEKFLLDLAMYGKKGNLTNIVVSSVNQGQGGQYETSIEADLIGAL